MTFRIFGNAARRTLATTAAKPSPALRAPLVILSPRWSSSSSSSRPDVPNPATTDQGATGPAQKQANAAGPSGRVPDAKLSDPYPLPFSPDIVDLNNADSGPESGPESKWAGLNLASERQTVDDVDAPMRVPGRESEERETKIARLVYQCRKRGTLETDLLLSTFAKKELKNLPNEELDEFDRVRHHSLMSHDHRMSQRDEKLTLSTASVGFETATGRARLGHLLLVHTA